MADNQDTFDAGLNLRRDMWGAAGSDDQLAAVNSFNGPFQDAITRYCFGEVWNRPLLDRKTRSMLTIAMLAVLAKPNQLRVHVRGAIANGCSADEIREVLMHVMIYGGVPAAADAFGNAEAVLAEMGLV